MRPRTLLNTPPADVDPAFSQPPADNGSRDSESASRPSSSYFQDSYAAAPGSSEDYSYLGGYYYFDYDPDEALQPVNVTAPLEEEGLTVVTTAVDLQRAIERGARDIEIRSHLDLRQLNRTVTAAPYAELHPLFQKRTHLMYVKEQTRSIRGNCSDPFAATSLITVDATVNPPPLPIKPRQCLLRIGDSMMQFVAGAQWLDNLYVRVERRRVDPGFAVLELGWNAPRPYRLREADIPAAQVFLTNVTVQGQRRGDNQVAALMRGSKLLAQDATDPRDEYAAADCTFADLYVGLSPFHPQFESSVAFSHSAILHAHLLTGLIEVASGGIVKFENTTVSAVRVPGGPSGWVTSETDDDWVFRGYASDDGDSAMYLSDDGESEVQYTVVPANAADAAPVETYLIEDDFLYDEVYDLFDYHLPGSFLPAEPWLHINDSWFVLTRSLLPQHAPEALAGPATQLPFTPRNAALWPESGDQNDDRSVVAAPDGGGAGTRGGLPRAQSVLLGSVFAAVLLVAIVGAWVILRGRSRSNRGAAAESNESALAQLSAARASAPPARTGSAREPERTPQQRAAADFLASNYRVQFMRHMPGRAPELCFRMQGPGQGPAAVSGEPRPRMHGAAAGSANSATVTRTYTDPAAIAALATLAAESAAATTEEHAYAHTITLEDQPEPATSPQ